LYSLTGRPKLKVVPVFKAVVTSAEVFLFTVDNLRTTASEAVTEQGLVLTFETACVVSGRFKGVAGDGAGLLGAVVETLSGPPDILSNFRF
jgi:hypothetical protein